MCEVNHDNSQPLESTISLQSSKHRIIALITTITATSILMPIFVLSTLHHDLDFTILLTKEIIICEVNQWTTRNTILFQIDK